MTEKYSGAIDGALSLLPEFDKVAPESFNLGKNANLDLVVRRPGAQTAEPAPVPVGMVSKTYRIIQHHEVLRAALSFTQQVPDSQATNVKIHATENCERIMFELMFGSAYAMSPDAHDVGLRLVCRNSVDGTSAVRSHLGWFRLVCSNGMVVGVTLGKTRIAHKPGADLGALFTPLKDQLAVVEKERTTLADWTSTRVSQSELRAWVDGPVPADAKTKDFGALSGPFRLLWELLLGLAERRDIPSLDAVAEEVLGVPASVLEDLKQKMPTATSVEAYLALRESDRMIVRCDGDEIPNKKRNRQRFPARKLTQQCLQMLAWILGGVLGVPAFLAEWLGKRVRFVAILPLDSPDGPNRTWPTCRNRFVVGGWRSWQAYAHLFRTEASDGSVCVDVSPLLEMALQSLRTTPIGWLANKCSETNELILSLMRRRGYVSNFDFGSPLESPTVQ